MGYCAQPTPEMGEYRTETRRESFYLKIDRDGFRFWSERGPIGLIEMATEDIPKIRAALDQVERVSAGSKE